MEHKMYQIYLDKLHAAFAHYAFVKIVLSNLQEATASEDCQKAVSQAENLLQKSLNEINLIQHNIRNDIQGLNKAQRWEESACLAELL